MAVHFDATTDIITAGTVTVPSTWTWYGWIRRPSQTRGSFFSINDGAVVEEIGIYVSNSTTDRLTIDRRTSGTSSQHTVSAANDGITWSASTWTFVAITQSGRSTPTVYTAQAGVPLATRTVTVANAGTGTATTTAGVTVRVGNWGGLDYGDSNADFAYFGFHNVILTAGEIEEAMLRGMTLRGLQFASPLESTSKLFDLSGNARSMSNSGASDVSEEPPVIPLWVNDQFWIQKLVAALNITGTPAVQTWSVPQTVPKSVAEGTAALATWSVPSPTHVWTQVGTAALQTWSMVAPTLKQVAEGVAALATWSVPTPVHAWIHEGVAALQSWTVPSPTLAEIMDASAGLVTYSQPQVIHGDVVMGQTSLQTWSVPAPTLAEIMAASTGVATYSQPQVTTTSGATAISALVTWGQLAHEIVGGAAVAMFDWLLYARRRRRM